jgi:hypothetical protein
MGLHEEASRLPGKPIDEVLPQGFSAPH